MWLRKHISRGSHSTGVWLWSSSDFSVLKTLKPAEIESQIMVVQSQVVRNKPGLFSLTQLFWWLLCWCSVDALLEDGSQCFQTTYSYAVCVCTGVQVCLSVCVCVLHMACRELQVCPWVWLSILCLHIVQQFHSRMTLKMSVEGESVWVVAVNIDSETHHAQLVLKDHSI